MFRHPISRRFLLKAASATLISVYMHERMVIAYASSDQGGTVYLPYISNPSLLRPPSTLRELGTRKNILFGTSVDPSEEWLSSEYEDAVNHFSVLSPSGAYLQLSIDKWGDDAAHAYREMANRHDQVLLISHGFWHADVRQSLKTASDDEILSYMRERVQFFLSFVEKTDKGHQPTHIIFINEPVWHYKGVDGWEDSPYYRLYGEKLVSETYLLFYREAVKQGLDIGTDLRLIYNDYDCYRAGGKADLVLNVLRKAKRDIAGELGVPENAVQLDIGLQYRFNPLLDPATHEFDELGFFPAPTADETEGNLSRFSEIAPIHITEFEIRGLGVQLQRTRMRLYQELSEVAIASKAVNSINYYGTFRVRPSDPSHFVYSGLFDNQYRPTEDYYSLLRGLSQ